MTIVYRDVKGADLTPNEVDGNFHDLDDRIEELETYPGEPISIVDVELVDDQLTFILSDSSELDPVTLPTVTYPWRGTWAPSGTYSVRDRFLAPDGRVYEVIFAHISELTFDAGANDGMGHNFYSVYQESPGTAIPVGGGAGYVLTKATDDDYDLIWLPAAAVAPVNEVTTDTFSPTANDANTYHRCTHADGCLVSIPLDADEPFPIGTELHFRQCTFQPVIIEETSDGPVINGIDGCLLETERRGAQITVKKIDTDEWDLGGLVAEGSV